MLTVWKEIKQNLVEYRDAPNNKQSNYLTNLINQCEIFYDSLTTATGKNKDNVNLVTIAITYSLMHLAILKEACTSHKGLFNSYDKELREKVEGYKKYFIEIYSKWGNWRKDCIQVKKNKDVPYEAYDNLIDQAVTY
ncbi:2040_t:CDS:2, partial [Racocetra persica]